MKIHPRTMVMCLVKGNFMNTKSLYKIDPRAEIYCNGDHNIIVNHETLMCICITNKIVKLANYLRINRYFSEISAAFPEDSMTDVLPILVQHGIVMQDGVSKDLRHTRSANVIDELKMPNIVAANITNKCNLACKYCYNADFRNSRKRPELDRQSWIHIFDSLLGDGVVTLDITGGEPLVRTDLYSVFSEFADKGMNLRLVTNATLIDNDKFAEYIAHTFRNITISIDSDLPEIHDSLRGEGTHEKVVNAMNLLSKYDGNWCAQMVFNESTMERIEHTSTYVRNLGARDFKASIEYVPKEGYSNRSILEYLISSVSKQSTTYGKSMDTFMKAQINSIMTVDRTCPAAKGECFIDAYGDIFPCRLMMSESMASGNLLEQSFKDIWATGGPLNMVREIDYTKIDKCGDCGLLRFCMGGCRAIAHNLTGDLYGYIGDENCALRQNAVMNRLFDTVLSGAN